ncbi:isochorismatase family protein [Candidatus Woesearchaeota archaeon]|nr:isochorismatase family protein [Candidatus Woesearchaeota archaeon]
MGQKVSRDRGKIAVLVVDIQNDFCDDKGIFAKQGLDVKPNQEVVPRIKEFIEKIRGYDIPIIYSKQIESEEISPENLKEQLRSGRMVCAPDSWGSELYLLEPAEGEYVLEKKTYDLFSNPEFKRILENQKIKTLVIIGVNTDICVDTTVRRAFTEGYRIIIPKDLVATVNKEGEKYYLAVFDRFFGDVIDSKTILSYLA